MCVFVPHYFGFMNRSYRSLYVVRMNTEGVGIFLMHLIRFYRTEINARYEEDAVSWGSGRNRS